MLVLVGLLASLAWADTVYLIGGRKVRGTVRRSEDKVIVTSPDGTVHELDAVDVLYIAQTVSDVDPAEKPDKPADQEPDPKAEEASRAQSLALLAPPELPVQAKFSPTQAQRPEEIVFHFLRSKIPGVRGFSVEGLDSRIEFWQKAVKDRKRKAGLQWVGPEEIRRLRKASQDAQEQARETYQKVRKIRSGGRRNDGPTRLQMAPVYEDLLGSARAWPDPTLRNLMLGIVYLRQGSNESAIRVFQDVLKTSPPMAAGLQGFALAHIQKGTPVEALPSLLELYRMKSESQDVRDLLLEGARAVSGEQRKHPDYLAAKEVLNNHGVRVTQGEDVRRRPRRRQRETWLLPGREEKVYDYELPVPVYDRLDFVQAVAVPLGPNTLLVDGSYLADALEVYVRIDSQTLVPARISRSRDEKALDELNLVSLQVDAATFEPLKTDPEAGKIEQGETLAFVALPMFQSMGNIPRVVPFRAKRDAKGQLLVPELLPGEAAAPVLTPSGKLAGFLSGRIDPMAALGGPHRFHDSKSVIEARSSGSSGLIPKRFRGRMGPEPAEAPEEALEARYFIVYAIMGEKM
jgi:hypothetical protein